MKKRYGFFRFAIYPLFATLLFSCTGIDLANLDDPSIYIDQSLVTPIGYAKQDAKQFLTKLNISNLNFDTHEIMVEWNNTRLDTIKVKAFNIADSISDYNKNILIAPSTYSKGVEYQIPSIRDSFDLGVNKEKDVNVRVDSIKVNTSIISVKLSTNNSALDIKDFTIQFKFPNQDTIRFHDYPSYDPIQQEFTLTNWDTYKDIQTHAYDLLLNGKEKVPYTILIKFKPHADIQANDGDLIHLNIVFKDVDSKVAYGKFDFDYQAEKFVDIPFNIDELIPDENLRKITFADPRFIVKATNYAGMNFDVTLDHVKVYKDGDTSSETEATFVTGTTKSPSTTISINGPSTFADSLITTLPTFNAENGGTDNFVNKTPFPDKINYKFNIVTNNNSRTTNDFVSPDSKITFDTKVQIPLYIKKGFAQDYSDTIVVTDLQKTMEKVDSAYLVLDVNNAFPLIGKFHMTFHKSPLPGDTIPTIGGFATTITSSTAGTITDNYIINPPQIDSDGLVVLPSPLPSNYYTQRICIQLSKDEITQLKDVIAISYKVYVANEDANGVEQLAHITTDCFFGVKIGVYVKANTTINQK